MWSHVFLLHLKPAGSQTDYSFTHEVLVKPANLLVMEVIMWGGRFTNKELWKLNGQNHINHKKAQPKPGSLSRSRLQNASWHYNARWNTAFVIIQWNVSAISEGLYVNRGDLRSSFSFMVCQKQLCVQGESVNKKGGWNHARWQPIPQTMHLIYANLKEQCLDSKSELCTIMTNIFF